MEVRAGGTAAIDADSHAAGRASMATDALAHAQLAGRGERLDGFLSLSRSGQDGWRARRLSDTLELCAWLSWRTP